MELNIKVVVTLTFKLYVNYTLNDIAFLICLHVLLSKEKVYWNNILTENANYYNYSSFTIKISMLLFYIVYPTKMC